jgi:hypothetical protein
MKPEANFSSEKSTHCTDAVTHSLLAVPITFKGVKPGVLAVVKKTGEAHYTEENPTIPETLVLQVLIASNNIIRNALDPSNPGRVGDASCVHAS